MFLGTGLAEIDDTTPIYTHAEAQTILDFIARALARSNDERLSIGYALQVELDIMCKQVGIEQPFDQIIPTYADEGMGPYGPEDGDYE